MDYTVILIAIAVIAALFIIGKIFAILTKMLFVIIIVALIAAGAFFWFNKRNAAPQASSPQSACTVIGIAA